MTVLPEQASLPHVTPDLFRGPLSGEAPNVEIESVAPDGFRRLQIPFFERYARIAANVAPGDKCSA